MDIALRHRFCYSLKRKIIRSNKNVKKGKVLTQNYCSFISFHIPSTPSDIKSLTNAAHQERTFDCVKSGKTQGPGHTAPEDGLEIL